MKKFLPHRFLFILIIPFIILIASFLLRSVSGPFWQFGDSAYNYIFNSFQILKGHSPSEIAHPGTPLQTLIAVMIWIVSFGKTAAGAVNQALIDPEYSLQAVYLFLTITSFLSSVFLGLYIYYKTNDKLAVLLAQLPGLSFLIMPSFDGSIYPVLPVVANINAEPCLIIIMNLFNLSLFGLYFSQKRSQELRYTLLLAFVCGLGLATKLDFLFIFLSALMLIPLRQKLMFIVACAVSFVLCTLPIVSKYPQLFQWVTDIVDHSSRYGTGTQEFINWKTYLFYLNLVTRNDWFFIFSALGLWIWSSQRLIKNSQDRNSRFIWVLTFCFFLHILATAKHFSFHYLLPAIALFGLILPLFYLNQKPRYKILGPLVIALTLIFVSVCIFYVIPNYNNLRVLTQDIHDFNDALSAKYPKCTIIPATTNNVIIYLSKHEAMLRGNGTTFRFEGEDLFRLYPNSYYLFTEELTSSENNESYGIWNYKQRVMGDDILNTCSCAIFVKFRSDFSSYPYQLLPLDQSKYLNAYLFVSSTEKAANELFEKAMDSFKAGDFKQALGYGIQSRQLNYEPRGQLEYFLNLIYQNFLRSQGK